MTYLAREHVKFLMLANSTDKWVREEIDAVREEIGAIENSCPFDVGVNAVMRRRQHDFSIVRQRTRGNYEAGQTETFTRRLYVHVCYKPAAAPIQERRLKESLFSIKKDLEDGVEEFRPAAQKLIDNFLIVKRTSKGVKVSFKNEKIEEAKRYWGYFVLVSNEICDPFEALKAYRSREKIEEMFATSPARPAGRPAAGLPAPRAPPAGARLPAVLPTLLQSPKRTPAYFTTRGRLSGLYQAFFTVSTRAAKL